MARQTKNREIIERRYYVQIHAERVFGAEVQANSRAQAIKKAKDFNFVGQEETTDSETILSVEIDGKRRNVPVVICQ